MRAVTRRAIYYLNRRRARCAVLEPFPEFINVRVASKPILYTSAFHYRLVLYKGGRINGQRRSSQQATGYHRVFF